MKKEKEEEVKKKMEINIRTMKEKEKFYQIIASIKKSPEAKIMKKNLSKTESSSAYFPTEY